MALPGAKPKDQKVTRSPVQHDWAEVPDAPYKGPRPNLSRLPDPGNPSARWPKATLRWWEVISRMPHCSLWALSDWEYAVGTAAVHAFFADGDMPRAAELRLREEKMGTTFESRRDLRIRYVPVEVPAATDNPGTVTDFEAERRRRLMESDAD